MRISSGAVFLLGLAVPVATVPLAPAAAQAADAARAPVQALCDGLIATMKAGKAAGAKGRAAVIGPIVDRTFDLPLMTRLVGAGWSAITPADQAALLTAFRRQTIAQYTSNFDTFEGERFTIDPKIDTRGGDRLVRTTLSGSGAPVALSYRLRQGAQGWRIIDVFYRDSISQLATRRADFARILQSGGAKALVKHLDAQSAKVGG